MGKPRTRLARSKRTEQALEEAERLILAKGFSFTTKEIAEAMDVTEAMIFHLFPSKGKIIEEAYRRRFSVSHSFRALPRESTIDYRKELLRYFVLLYRHFECTQKLELLYLAALDKSKYRPLPALFKRFGPDLAGPLTGYFQSGIDKGFFRSEPAKQTAEYFHSLLFQHFFFRNILLRETVTDKELTRRAARIVELFLDGARPRIEREMEETE
jgi:AcrR family transcriptional regulator